MRSTLRVAVLATVVDFGGIEQVLLTQLRHTGAEVDLIPILFTRSSANQGPFFERLDALAHRYDTFALDTSRYKYLNPIRNLREAIGRIKGGGFDLIHTHGYRANLIGLMAAKVCGLPVVATCHGFIRNDRHLDFYTKLDMFLLRYFSAIISVSDRLASELVESGIDSNRLRVIANAVSYAPAPHAAHARRDIRARLQIDEGDFVFGYVGRISEEKGLSDLVEAVQRWDREDDRWRVIVVGDGPQRDALERKVHDCGLGRRVFFVGFQNDMSKWYAAMDAFVLPSHTEGTPMVLLEAMATGIPAIATAVGGVPAIIDSGKNGLLVPSSDPAGLSDAMRSIARDEPLRARLSDNAKGLIREEYGVENWMSKITSVYLAALARRSRA